MVLKLGALKNYRITEEYHYEFLSKKIECGVYIPQTN